MKFQVNFRFNFVFNTYFYLILALLEKLNSDRSKNRDLKTKQVAWDLIKIYFYNFENLELKFNDQTSEDFDSVFPKLLYSLKNLPESGLNAISSWIFKYYQNDKNCVFEELRNIACLEDTERNY